MPKTNTYSTTAANYARALLELAKETNNAEPIGAELAGLRQVIDATPAFAQFLADPAIGQTERQAVLDKAIKPSVSPLIANFLGVLGQHGRLGILDQIAAAYKDQLDKLLGNVEVEVTVAQKLTDEQLEAVKQKVSTALKKNAILNVTVDESIIGGLVLKVEDKLIDASVRYQLEAMKKQLLKRA